MSKERIEFIDIARGIGILLVIFGHVVWGGNYPVNGAVVVSNFIYSFHMPLFFVLSGICIKDSKNLNWNSFKKMVYVYLVPYAIWTVVYVFLFQFISLLTTGQSLISFDNYLFAHAISLCGLAPLWFLLALCIAEVIVLFIKPFLKTSVFLIFACIILAFLSEILSVWYTNLGGIGLLSKNYLMGLLRICPTSFFILFGYGIKDRIVATAQWTTVKRFGVIVFLLALQIWLCVRWNEEIDVQLFILANPWLYFIKAINGTLLTILIAQMIHSKTIAFIGSKTKELMVLHYPPFYYTLVLRTVLGHLFSPNFVGAIIITIITLISCLIIDAIMSKTMIWRIAMGKVRRVNSES